MSAELGKYVTRDVKLLQQLGWKHLVQSRRPRSDLSAISFQHSAARILKMYKHHGIPVRLRSAPWSSQQISRALVRGPHQFCRSYLKFLEGEFVDMIEKGQWVVLPYSAVKSLPNLRLSPPGVVPQRERRLRWIVDLSCYGIKDDTLDIVPVKAMQFGHALDRYLREILLANPKLGPIYMLKLDISNGFYRIDVNIDDVPKLGVVFPTPPGVKPPVAFPLVLPMGWKNSPPAFCVATETAADLTNTALASPIVPLAYPLNHHAAALDDTHTISSPTASTPPASQRDPYLPFPRQPLSYVGVFMDDFIALAQGKSNRQRVRLHLFHAVDSVFRPNDYYDILARREPISLSKLRKGDCSWSTIKTILGWVLNTVARTISLPLHRQERLGKILESIPSTQKRTSVKALAQNSGRVEEHGYCIAGGKERV